MHRSAFLFLAFLLFFLLPFPVAAELKIDRVWEGEYGYGYALVTFTNTSRTTFKSSVTIECVALDAKGNNGFYAFERGPIGPGFTGTLRVSVKLNRVKLRSMTCSWRGR